MKLLVVLSQVNYMPENYNGLLEGLAHAFAQNAQNSSTKVEIKGCASLKTMDASLLKSIASLPLVGVYNLPKQLLKNIASCLKKEREKMCQSLEIEHLNWQSMNGQEALTWVKKNKIDIILNLRTRCIYKEPILEAPKLGCVNIHHGILPQYRGTFCDLYALAESREAGFSIHKMAKKIDAGEIYKTQVVDTGLEKNYSLYLKRTIDHEIKSLIDFINSCSKTPELALPQGMLNSHPKPVYTKNPTPQMIKVFKKKGMIL